MGFGGSLTLPVMGFRGAGGMLGRLGNVVERQGVIKLLTVRNLVFVVPRHRRNELSRVLKVRPVRGPGLQWHWRSYGRSILRTVYMPVGRVPSRGVLVKRLRPRKLSGPRSVGHQMAEC